MKAGLKYLLFISAIVNARLLQAQNENNKWFFGDYRGVDFMTNPPTVLTGSMNTMEGCASIADAAGNLLFYTDGSSVWNQNHQVMGNGTNMGGNSSTTQSSIIVKQPGSSTIYYIFSLDQTWQNSVGDLRYSIVDMSLAAGLGSVTVNGTFISTLNTEKLTSVKHCNGTDFWVLCPPANQATLNAYLVTAAGVNTVPVISSVPGMTLNFQGNMKTSPNGKRIAFANGSGGPGSFGVCDFDNSTGLASNYFSLGAYNNTPYGVEFSPDGTKLYGSHISGFTSTIYQWNLCAGSPTTIASSVYTISTNNDKGGMQLATNGKIYISRFANSLAVINDPNNLGAACNFSNSANFTFPGGQGSYNLLNFITSGFSSPPNFTYTISALYGCNTASFNASALQSYQQNVCTASGFTGLMWDFGDPASGAANTSTISNPLHTFPNLGTYTVNLIMYNANPCGATNVTVTQIVNMNLFCVSVVNQSITCATLGSASVTAQNGVGPFTYTWLPSGQTSSIATGLNPGTHTLYAYDTATGLTYTTTTTFVSPVPYTGTVSNSLNQPCAAVNTATAGITLAGGSGTQSYTWTGPNGVQTTSLATGLGAGNYTVNVIDAVTSCSVTQNFTIGLPPPPLGVFVYSGSPSVCAGSSVSLLAFGVGGVPVPAGVNYSWTNGPSTDTYTATPTTTGNVIYTVTISDANNCSLSATIPVSVIANPTISVSNTSVCPQQTGTLIANGASGYSWSTGASTNSLTANPLTTTVYTVTGSALGCISSATASIILLPLPVPVITSNSLNCSNLSLTGSGGSAYIWNGPSGFSSFLPNPVINPANTNNSGVYNLTVTAANSCTAFASINVTVNLTPGLASSGATVCTTQTLTLLANATGAVSYTWSGPGNFSSSAVNPVIPNPALSASGIYTLTVTSAEGCTNSAQVNVSVNALPIPAFTSNSPKCEGSTLFFNSSGSSGGSSYNWTGPNGYNSSLPNPVITNAGVGASGMYTLTLSQGPCAASISQSVTIFQNPVPLIIHNAPLCETKTFSASVNNTYNSYQWIGPMSFTNSSQNFAINTASIQQSGTYTVVVTDINTCQGQAVANIIIMPNPILAAVGTTVCYGQAAVIGATGANTYSWSGPGGFTAFTSQVTISPALNTTPLTYYVIGQSLNTCTSVATVQVSTKTLPVVTATLTQRACVNSPVYFQGDGGVNYNWKGPSGFIHAGQNFSMIVTNASMAGNYTLAATDAQGCTGYATANLIVDLAPQGALWRSNPQNCIPFCSDFKLIPTGVPIVNSTWQLNDHSFSTESFNYCFTKAGDYILRGDFTDTRSCTNSVFFTIKVYSRPQADFNYFPQEPIEGSEIQFESVSTGTDLKNYSWYFAKNNPSGKDQPYVNYTFPDPGVYPVAMVIKNKWGCEDTVVKAITVLEDFYIYIPNAFTPNADNLNETFKVVGRGVTTFSMEILNRWGQMLYQTTDISAGWDGTFKGQVCKDDVYTWKIEATSINGKEKKLNGSVLLYR